GLHHPSVGLGKVDRSLQVIRCRGGDGRLPAVRLPMDNPSRLTWLVKHRAEIQHLIHDLYQVLNDESLRKRLETKPADCSIFGLFIGAAFSLWRAAFLIDASRDEWPAILQAAEKFLQSLAHDNAITYNLEQNCKEWAVGFYLNNARYRLYRIRDKVQEIETTNAFQKLKVQQDIGIDNRSVQEHWETIYGALHKAVCHFLETRELLNDQMFINPT
ncbi:MAG: hypothetical protein ACREWG_11870, partial [Gammaproteobacteria bacterium]